LGLVLSQEGGDECRTRAAAGLRQLASSLWPSRVAPDPPLDESAAAAVTAAAAASAGGLPEDVQAAILAAQRAVVAWWQAVCDDSARTATDPALRRTLLGLLGQVAPDTAPEAATWLLVRALAPLLERRGLPAAVPPAALATPTTAHAAVVAPWHVTSDADVAGLVDVVRGHAAEHTAVVLRSS
jgi:hypothetical protein